MQQLLNITRLQTAFSNIKSLVTLTLSKTAVKAHAQYAHESDTDEFVYRRLKGLMIISEIYINLPGCFLNLLSECLADQNCTMFVNIKTQNKDLEM